MGYAYTDLELQLYELLLKDIIELMGSHVFLVGPHASGEPLIAADLQEYRRVLRPSQVHHVPHVQVINIAEAVSNMLDHRVDITTPTVTVVDVKDFSLGNLEPAIGVEIKYVEGLEGSNIMLLKRSDIKVIVDILMGMESRRRRRKPRPPGPGFSAAPWPGTPT